MLCEKCNKEIKKPRTQAQNRSLHLFFTQLSQVIQESGYSVQEVLAQAMDMEWTSYRVKSILWANSQKKLLGKESTTELKKQEDIDVVYDHLNRFLGSEPFFIEVPPFPSEAQLEVMDSRFTANKGIDR